MIGPEGDAIVGDIGSDSLGEDADFCGRGLVGYAGATPGRSMSKEDRRFSGGSGDVEGLSSVLMGVRPIL